MKNSDLDLILEWRNHPDIRKKMFNQEKIELKANTKGGSKNQHKIQIKNY